MFNVLYFIGDSLVKSQESDDIVITPWRDRWTFYEAFIIQDKKVAVAPIFIDHIITLGVLGG